MPLLFVWGGIGAYFLGWVVESPIALAISLALSVCGLVRYHRDKGHPTRCVVIAVILALIPFFGPMIGLVIKPRNSHGSMRNQMFGIVGMLLGAIVAIASALSLKTDSDAFIGVAFGVVMFAVGIYYTKTDSKTADTLAEAPVSK